MSWSLSGVGTSNTPIPIATNTTSIATTFNRRLIVNDEKGEEIEIGKWTKMFKWYVQTYHPHIEHEFQAVEDTKENI